MKSRFAFTIFCFVASCDALTSARGKERARFLWFPMQSDEGDVSRLKYSDSIGLPVVSSQNEMFGRQIFSPPSVGGQKEVDIGQSDLPPGIQRYVPSELRELPLSDPKSVVKGSTAESMQTTRYEQVDSFRFKVSFADLQRASSGENPVVPARQVVTNTAGKSVGVNPSKILLDRSFLAALERQEALTGDSNGEVIRLEMTMDEFKKFTSSKDNKNPLGGEPMASEKISEIKSPLRKKHPSKSGRAQMATRIASEGYTGHASETARSTWFLQLSDERKFSYCLTSFAVYASFFTSLVLATEWITLLIARASRSMAIAVLGVLPEGLRRTLLYTKSQKARSMPVVFITAITFRCIYGLFQAVQKRNRFPGIGYQVKESM